MEIGLEVRRAFTETARGSKLRRFMAKVLAARVDAEPGGGGELPNLPEIDDFFNIPGFQDEFTAAVKKPNKRRRLQ